MDTSIQNLLFANEPSTRPASLMSGPRDGGVDAAGAADFREELASLTKRGAEGAGGSRDGETDRAGADKRAEPGDVAERGKDTAAAEAEPTDDAAHSADETGASADKAEDAADDSPVDGETDDAADQADAVESAPVAVAAETAAVVEAAVVAETTQPGAAAGGEDAKQAAAAGLAPAREGEAKEDVDKRGPRIAQVKGKAATAAKVSAESADPAAAGTTQPTANASLSTAATTVDADPAADPPLAVQTPARGQAKSAAPAPATPSAPVTANAITPTTAQAVATAGPTMSTVSAPADATAAREADNAALNGARLARGLASAVNQRGGAVTLRLTPPEMGTVRIQMQLTGTVLSASMHAESASAHQMLTQQLGQLRTSLETQGLTVERLHVQTMQQAQPGSASQQNGDSEQQQQQHNEGRSRGRQQGGSGDTRDGAPGRDSGGKDTPRPQTFNEQLNQSSADPLAA